MHSFRSAAAYCLPAGSGLTELWWLGGRLTVKVSGEQTDGRFALLELDDPRGTAPPLHIHRQEDEAFLVLQGEVDYLVGEHRYEATAGTLVFAPRGLPHSYVVRSDRALAVVTVVPAGLESFFAELGTPVVKGEPEPEPVIPDPELFARSLAPYGVEIIGPPPKPV
jgi:quercetin dioxygenase-like cupin family protein